MAVFALSPLLSARENENRITPCIPAGIQGGNKKWVFIFSVKIIFRFHPVFLQENRVKIKNSVSISKQEMKNIFHVFIFHPVFLQEYRV